MNSKITFLLVLCFLFETVQICSAQNTDEKISIDNMPIFVKELQQNFSATEIKRTDPKLYQHLLKRRQELSLLLINEAKQHKLSESALQYLQPHLLAYNNVSSNSFTDKTTEGNFRLVKDINQLKNSNPSNGNYYYSIAKNYAVLNKIIYYAADDGIHGVELWRSDGTAAGTYIIKNINPGSASSYPKNITTFNNNVYFSAFTEGRDYELYQSDGTTSGTILLKGINAGVRDVTDLTTANDKLYFTTHTSLWKTDGTGKGTVLVKDLGNSLNAYDLQQLISLKGNVFFTAQNNSHGREVWYSDGTAAGTYMVKDINPDSANNFFYGPMNFTVYNGKLYFSAFDGYTRTLWKTDGTAESTKKIMNNVQIVSALGVPIEDDVPFAIAKNEMYFAGYNSSTGVSLYKYNFNAGNTILVKTLSPNETYISFYSESIRSMNDSIYFSLTNSAGTGYDLWKSGGTSTSTNIIRSFSEAIDIYNFYSLGKKLYFNAYTTDSGNEPWNSDGTSAGTKLLKDINAGGGNSNPLEFTQCNGKIYFRAYSPAGGMELWKTDGTATNTKQVKDINVTSSASALNSSRLINLNANEIVFAASTPDAGTDLWKSNGTESGTTLVKDLPSGKANNSLIKFYDSKNGKAYFTIYNDTTTLKDIYITDGSALGTKRIALLTGSLNELQAANNGIVFYTLYDYHTGSNELWRTDNTGNNFRLSLNIVNINGDEMGVAGNICYFSCNNQVWKSDGTISGTKLLSGTVNNGYWYTCFGNKILFMASGSPTYGLWVSDGTASGTILLKSMITNLNYGAAILNDKLYFNGSDIKGSELYKTDGTPNGTKLVKDIMQGDFLSSYPTNFTTVNNSVYFTVTGINNQTELWKTSGTDASTRLVKVLSSRNLESHDINNFTSAAGKLYFIDSTQLWVSDETDTGTHVIIDPSNITSVNSLAAAGNKLFYDGYSYNYGDELYINDGTNDFKQQNNAIAKKFIRPTYNVQLLSNPFINDIHININSPQKQQLQITVNTLAGQVLINKAINVNAGNNLLTFDATKYLHGVYTISISSSSETISLKAIK